MPTIQIFDPALCCSTGVCGVDVDQHLVSFAADVDWLKKQGASVERFNLAQQPQIFAKHVAIRQLLESHGDSALPAVVVDGNIKQSGAYPSRDQLAAWAGIAPAASSLQAVVAAAAGAAPSQGACCGVSPGPTASAASKCC